MARSRSAKRKYLWSKGVPLGKKVAAQFGEALERVRQKVGDSFEAAHVVDEARPKTSPIHRLFEWDNAVAAEKFRQDQARGYIRALVVIVGDHDERPMPAAVSFGSGDGYVDTEAALSSSDMRAMMLARALAEARQWRARYNTLRELAGVFEALDRVSRGQARQDVTRHGTARPV